MIWRKMADRSGKSCKPGVGRRRRRRKRRGRGTVCFDCSSHYQDQTEAIGNV
ncbi:hypothetical protein JG688_00018017 [Phytophthora aleatoria]|uniref:Uncharacterized protein n=1 Tax=Phytophthora aleatoria TaxID=2496075 RepID=A0A8J5IGJ4_9STRA|nr:hypothetical protein JG688_00018017 [Phytophthora aleatoria]